MSTDAILESLAAKLNSLELTDDERAAFAALLGVEPEVAGFSKNYVGALPVIQGFNLAVESRLKPTGDVHGVSKPTERSIDADFGPAIK